MKSSPQPMQWFSLIDISGPFLAGRVIEDAFPQGLDKVDTPRRQRLRAAYEEWRDAVDEDDPQLSELHDAWVWMVISEALEYEEQVLVAREQLGDEVVHRVPEHGVEERPDFAVRTDDGAYRLLISTYPPGTDLEKPGKHDRWPVSPAERMTSLCRASEVRLGLITNGEQWMLVNAPIGSTSSYASWFARIWWQEPITLKAFVSLLGVRRCFGPDEGRLDQLLEKSLEFQEEVTDTLGEQVRRAVEVLIQALGRTDQDRNGELLKDVSPETLYEAGLTVMMRLVFILCAEERNLLLLGDPIYDQYYAISSLRARLREDADQHGIEVLERRKDAWSQILAVFRMVYGGVEHEALRLPALGGSLFDPDKFPFLEGRSAGSSWREDPASPLPIDNRTVLLIMNALQVLEQKGGAQLLSYRALDVEQIGHVYEGLLEHTVVRLSEPTVVLIGTKKVRRPTITVRELESIADEPLESGAKKLSTLTGLAKSTMKKVLHGSDNESHRVALIQSCGGDDELVKRLLPFATLIQTDSWESLLVYQEGAFAIVPGTDRRETGTHYTPRSLTEPIVQHTLEPLVYIGPAVGQPREDWKLKSAAELLALNICDMACGSGAFLVETVRYLGQRLVEAWGHAEEQRKYVTSTGVVVESAGDHELLPAATDDRILAARRLVAQSCIYGVDINHLAVELAKLSLWLITLAKSKPFGFLDHAIRCGDSLVGIHDIEQLKHFNLKPNNDDMPLFTGPLSEAVHKAVNLRLNLEDMSANTVEDVEAQEKLLAEAEGNIVRLRCAADLLVAAEFWGTNAKDKQKRVRHAANVSGQYVEHGSTEEFEQNAAKERRSQKMFHWPLEFPEVIVRLGGFDAFVGNPPFMGGRKISGNLGKPYRDYLDCIILGTGFGNADLVSCFLLRTWSLLHTQGGLGLLTTSAIAEGNTREAGLERIASSHGVIHRALTGLTWSGSASVTFVLFWIRSGWTGINVLNESIVDYISPYLSDMLSLYGDPKKLRSNRSISYQGVITHGTGFVIDTHTANKILSKDKNYQRVIFNYLTGKELNSQPELPRDKYIINFFDWPLQRKDDPNGEFEFVASDFPECIAILEKRVRPERAKKSKDVAAWPWWRYWRNRPKMFQAVAPLSHFLGIATQATKYVAFERITKQFVFSHAIAIIASDDNGLFAVVSSSFHEVWARHFGSYNLELLRYSPSDLFETFPLPRDITPARNIGQRYYDTRKAMMQVFNEGLTSIYNRFHKPDESSEDIRKFRELHVEMDQTVANTYGWNDIDLDHGFHETRQGLRYTISDPARREVLQRLLKLNYDRYEEEVKRGLHRKKKRL